MGYLEHIDRCNDHDVRGFVPFIVAGEQVGWVRQAMLPVLAACADVFLVEADAVSLNPVFGDAGARSAAIAGVTPDLIAAGLPGRLRGEMYAVKSSWSAPEVLRLDRGIAAAFGVKAYGVHVNGYVRRPDGGLSLWIGRRAPDKAVEPDKLDNMVAGGQPADLSLWDNLIKESAEEASVPAAMLRDARAVGMITYCMESAEGLKPDTLFCYDVELPADFTPVPGDDEMVGFTLMPAEDVLSLVRQGYDFKFNVALVILDFAVRHGLLQPDAEPAYEALVKGLRSPHPGRG